MKTKTGRQMGSLAELDCAYCKARFEATFEEWAAALGGKAPRCPSCSTRTDATPVVAGGSYDIAIMRCRLCRVVPVLLPPAEALELLRQGRGPLCGVCFVEREGPRLVVEAAQAGRWEEAEALRREIERAEERIRMMSRDPTGVLLAKKAAEAIMNDALRFNRDVEGEA